MAAVNMSSARQLLPTSRPAISRPYSRVCWRTAP